MSWWPGASGAPATQVAASHASAGGYVCSCAYTWFFPGLEETQRMVAL